MKKLFLSIVLAFAISSGFAQDEYKFGAGDMGIAFGIRGVTFPVISTVGPTGTLVFKYAVTDDIVARVAFNLTTAKTETVFDTTGTGIGEQKTFTFKSSSWVINLGGEYHLGGASRIDPYAALDFTFGGTNGESVDRDEIIGGANTGDFQETTITKVGAGSSLGINLGVGANFFLTQKFAIGIEFNYGYAKTTTGKKPGETITEIGGSGVQYNPLGTVTTPNPGTVSKTTGLSTSGGALITVNAFF